MLHLNPETAGCRVADYEEKEGKEEGRKAGKLEGQKARYFSHGLKHGCRVADYEGKEGKEEI